MPSHNWLTDPVQIIQAFEARHSEPEAGALLSWAVYCVESLHYLDDIDYGYDVSHSVVGGHRPDIADVSHARWSTGTSITALDLCAAGLGRALCGHTSIHEPAMSHFAPRPSSNRRTNRLRSALPPAARQWIDGVFHDTRYSDIKAARDTLTHSRIRRHFTLAINRPPQRLKLSIGNAT